MSKRFIFHFSFTIIITAITASCQPQSKDGQNTLTTEDIIVSQAIQPSESGYANVNGVKMYYEMYAAGKLLVPLQALS